MDANKNEQMTKITTVTGTITVHEDGCEEIVHDVNLTIDPSSPNAPAFVMVHVTPGDETHVCDGAMAGQVKSIMYAIDSLLDSIPEDSLKAILARRIARSILS